MAHLPPLALPAIHMLPPLPATDNNSFTQPLLQSESVGSDDTTHCTLLPGIPQESQPTPTPAIELAVTSATASDAAPIPSARKDAAPSHRLQSKRSSATERSPGASPRTTGQAGMFDGIASFFRGTAAPAVAPVSAYKPIERFLVGDERKLIHQSIFHFHPLTATISLTATQDANQSAAVKCHVCHRKYDAGTVTFQCGTCSANGRDWNICVHCTQHEISVNHTQSVIQLEYLTQTPQQRTASLQADQLTSELFNITSPISTRFGLYRLAVNKTKVVDQVQCSLCQTPERSDAPMFHRLLNDTGASQVPMSVVCLRCTVNRLSDNSAITIAHSDCTWNGRRPWYESSHHRHPLALYEMCVTPSFTCAHCGVSNPTASQSAVEKERDQRIGTRPAQSPQPTPRVSIFNRRPSQVGKMQEFISDATRIMKRLTNETTIIIRNDNTSLSSPQYPRFQCGHPACAFSLCIQCAAQEMEANHAFMHVRLALPNVVGKHPKIEDALSAHKKHLFYLYKSVLTVGLWTCSLCNLQQDGAVFSCKTCRKIYESSINNININRSSKIATSGSNCLPKIIRNQVCNEVCISCIGYLLRHNKHKATLIHPLPHLDYLGSDAEDVLDQHTVAEDQSSGEAFPLTIMLATGHPMNHGDSGAPTVINVHKHSTIGHLLQQMQISLADESLVNHEEVRRIAIEVAKENNTKHNNNINNNNAVKRTRSAKVAPAPMKNDQSTVININPLPTVNDAAEEEDVEDDNLVEDELQSDDEVITKGIADIQDKNVEEDAGIKTSAAALKAEIMSATEAKTLDLKTVVKNNHTYDGLVACVWFEGQYLNDPNKTLLQCGINHTSTVYLMFKYDKPTATHQQVYQLEHHKHTFSIFVRHRESRTLIRVLVQEGTFIRKIKSMTTKQTHRPEHDINVASQAQHHVQHAATETDDHLDPNMKYSKHHMDTLKRTVLLHHGRVLYDDNTVYASDIKAGDVIVLLDKVDDEDIQMNEEYNKWFPDRICNISVLWDPLYDLHALHEQTRQYIDRIIFSTEYVNALKHSFTSMDRHHSGYVDSKHMALGIHMFLQLLQAHLKHMGAAAAERWLASDEHHITGSITIDHKHYAFEQPSVFPVSRHMSFDEYRRFLSDTLCECIRHNTLDRFYPDQSFEKPVLEVSAVMEAEMEEMRIKTANADSHTNVITGLEALVQINHSAHGHRDDTTTQQRPQSHHGGHHHHGHTSHRSTSSIPMDHSYEHNAEFLHASAAQEHAAEHALKEWKDLQQKKHDGTWHINQGKSIDIALISKQIETEFLTSIKAVLLEDFDPKHEQMIAKLQAKKSGIIGYGKTIFFNLFKFIILPFTVFNALFFANQLKHKRSFISKFKGKFGWLIYLPLFLGWLLYTILFYLPFSMIIVYHVWSLPSGISEVSPLEVYIPFYLTTVLMICYVSDAAVSEIFKGEDADKLTNAYETGKLLWLEMRAQPVCIQYENDNTNEEDEEDNNTSEDDNNNDNPSIFINILSCLSAVFDRISGMFERMTNCFSGLTPTTTEDDEDEDDGNNDGNNQETNVTESNNNNSNTTSHMHSVTNDIGDEKRLRLTMSYTLLSSSIAQYPLKQYIFMGLLTILYCIIAGSYRVDQLNKNFIGNEWFDNLIVLSVFCTSPIIFNFLHTMYNACTEYHHLAQRLNNLTLVATAQDAYTHHLNFYLDISKPNNLEYWLFLRENSKKMDIRLLNIMCCALLLDSLLLIITFYRVMFLHISIDLFAVITFTMVAIVSLFILLFLLIVVQSNTILSVDHLQLIQQVRQSLSVESCSDELWYHIAKGVNYYDTLLDTWSDVAEFDAVHNVDVDVKEYEEHQTEKKLKEAEIMQMESDRHENGLVAAAGSMSITMSISGAAAETSMSLPPADILSFEASSNSESEELCEEHSRPLHSCITCSIADAFESSQLLTNEAFDYRHKETHETIHAVRRLVKGADEKSATALQGHRFAMQCALLDSTLQHLQTMDEPVEILGFVINQALVAQAVTLIGGGLASALYGLLPS